MNNFFLSPAQRLFSIVGAIAITTTLFFSAAASAQTGGRYYQATLTAPTDATRAVAGAVAWNCNGTTCSAPRGTSRPAIMCARFVREVGTVTNFVSNGQALDAQELARCNAAA